MRLTPQERDRLLIFTAAQLAAARRARGLRLNVPEATALIAHTVIEAARDGHRLADAVAAGRSVLGADDVLPGVPEVLPNVRVEAVFDDGTRLVVVTDPFGGPGLTAVDATAPGAEGGHPKGGQPRAEPWPDLVGIVVRNTAGVPVSVTSHWHFFEVNAALRFDRAAAYGRRLAIPAGDVIRFDPDVATAVELTPIGGQRVAIGFAGLVDGPLDAPGAQQAAVARARALGYQCSDPGENP